MQNQITLPYQLTSAEARGVRRLFRTVTPVSAGPDGFLNPAFLQVPRAEALKMGIRIVSDYSTETILFVENRDGSGLPETIFWFGAERKGPGQSQFVEMLDTVRKSERFDYAMGLITLPPMGALVGLMFSTLLSLTGRVAYHGFFVSFGACVGLAAALWIYFKGQRNSPVVS